MLNPSILLQFMNEKNQFEQRHPKFAAFVSKMLSGEIVEEGTVIEITVTRPSGEKIVSNMKVAQEDVDLFRMAKSVLSK